MALQSPEQLRAATGGHGSQPHVVVAIQLRGLEKFIEEMASSVNRQVNPVGCSMATFSTKVHKAVYGGNPLTSVNQIYVETLYVSSLSDYQLLEEQTIASLLWPWHPRNVLSS